MGQGITSVLGKYIDKDVVTTNYKQSSGKNAETKTPNPR